MFCGEGFCVGLLSRLPEQRLSGSLEGVSLEVCVVRQTLAIWDAVCIDWHFQAANQSSSFWVPLLSIPPIQREAPKLGEERREVLLF